MLELRGLDYAQGTAYILGSLAAKRAKERGIPLANLLRDSVPQ